MTKISFISDTHCKDTNPANRRDNYFQSILDKIEQVLQDSDYLFILGDIFDAPIVSTLCVNRLNMLFRRYEASGKVIKLLLGNHDMIGQNNKNLVPTSIGSLFISNPKRRFTTPMDIEGINIIPMLYYGNDVVYTPHTKNGINILCGHALFEISDDFTVTSSQIHNDIDYVILGHDHRVYPEQLINNKTILFRTGSFARKDRDENNLTRIPCYLQYCTDTKEFILKQVSCEFGNSIFTEELKNEVNDVFRELDLSELKEALKGKQKISLFSILKDVLNLDTDMIQFIQDIRTRQYKENI